MVPNIDMWRGTKFTEHSPHEKNQDKIYKSLARENKNMVIKLMEYNKIDKDLPQYLK